MSEPSDDITPKQDKPRKKMGRPSKYAPEIAAEICERLSNGEPLRQICRDEHMPAWTSIYAWAAADKELSERIAQAREQGYDAIAEDLLQIADTPLMGEEETSSNNGLTITRKDMLGHRKLQIETRLKLLAKWNPKKYGDRQIVAGDADNPLSVVPEASFFADLLTKMEQTRRDK
jgi:predicted secreted protein